MSQDAFPPGYLKSENRLTSEQADAAQTPWMTKTTARNGGVPVLGQGWDFKNSGINPTDLALLDTQEWDANVICAAYGVPSVLLNMTVPGGLTYQNPLALMQMWWLTELRTTAKRIADAFTAQMLPRGQWVHVDASDITQELNAGAEDDPQVGATSSRRRWRRLRRPQPGVDSYRRWQEHDRGTAQSVRGGRGRGRGPHRRRSRRPVRRGRPCR